MSNSLASVVAADQAQGLRQWMGGHSTLPPSVLGFLSHSKMRGQITQQIDVLLSIASSLCALGHSVLVVDADRLLIGARVGLRLRYELADWVDGECLLNDILQTSAGGISIMSAAKALSCDDALRSYLPVANAGITALFRIIEGRTAESMQSFDFVFIAGSASVFRLLSRRTLHSMWLITTTQKASLYGAAQSAASLLTFLGDQSIRIVYSDAVDAHDCETAHVTLLQLVERLELNSSSTSQRLQFAGAIEIMSLDSHARSQQMIHQIASNVATRHFKQTSFSAAR
jgi:hypothetical protein